MDSFRKAAIQAARRAFVAMKRPGETNSDVILIVVVGPFWMRCMASRAQILDSSWKKFWRRPISLEKKDSFQEQKVVEIDKDSACLSSALLCSITKQNVFQLPRADWF